MVPSLATIGYIYRRPYFQILLAQGPLIPLGGSDYQHQNVLVNPNILHVTVTCT